MIVLRCNIKRKIEEEARRLNWRKNLNENLSREDRKVLNGVADEAKDAVLDVIEAFLRNHPEMDEDSAFKHVARRTIYELKKIK